MFWREALLCLSILFVAGSAVAQQTEAQCYGKTLFEQGKDKADRNPSKAAASMKQACDCGFPEGCTMLGAYLEEGRGVKKDAQEAIRKYQRGCDLDYNWGCYKVASSYGRGITGEKDLPRAKQIYERLCGKKYGRGCVTLGYMYGHGEVGPVNRDKERKYTRLACDYGVYKACDYLARKYEEDSQDPQHFEKKVAILEQACKAKHPNSCAMLAEHYRTEPHVDWGRYEKYVTLICEMGIASGCISSAAIYEYRDDMGVVARYYRRACKLGGGRLGCKMAEQLCSLGCRQGQAAPGALDRLWNFFNGFELLLGE